MSEKNPNDNAYEIGYKRPPRSTRFKPGRSGNPKGRQRVPEISPRCWKQS